MKYHIIRIFCLAFSLIFLGGADSAAQNLQGGSHGRSSSRRSPAESKIDEKKNPVDSTAKKRKSSAWTLETPLGVHEPAIVDTLQYNYQRRFIPSLASDAYASTGTLGAEGINMIYFQRRPAFSTFFFDNALDTSLPSLKTMKFYNVYTPMTLLGYNFGGNKHNHADRLDAIFAGNVNRNIGIGAFVDYNYGKGAYNYQAVKDFSFGFTFYFNSHRYEAQALYYHFNSLNKENGGITDDLYITDPAEVQGGVSKVEPKSIPTRLNNAHTRLNGDRLFTTHALKLGYWSEEQVNDTLTRDIYIPVTRIVYSLDYQGRHHNFTNSNASQAKEFWKYAYLNPENTEDNTRYWTVTNTIGIELLEGFRKWAKFGLSAYASLDTRRTTMTTFYPSAELSGEQLASLTPLPEGFHCDPRANHTLLSVGASLSKKRGELLKYSADVKFGLVGNIAGDVDASGKVSTRFRMLGDTVAIEAHGGFHNNANSYLLDHYISNHFAWNQRLGKTRRYEFGGSLLIPWTRTFVSADFRNLQNYVYFNNENIPTMHSGNVQVFAISLDQKLRFGIWNWNNTITYQVSSDKNVLPLPALAIYSNMYLDFRAFKVLNIQLGIDCDYYTRYYGYAYQPATMTFHTQHEKEVGNFAFCNAYLSCKLYKVRFYVLWSHVNQGWFSKNYFSLPGYPVNPRCLQFGLCVDFAN